MIIELGLLLVTYVGSKILESTKTPPPPAGPGLLPAAPGSTALVPTPPPAESREEIEKRQRRNLLAAGLSMGFFALGFFVPGANLLGLVAYLYGAIPYMKDVEKALVRDKKVNATVLFFVADALTLGLRNYFTAALGLAMLHHGRYIVNKVRDDSAKKVAHLFRELPQSVWKRVGDLEIETPLADIKAGDLLLVTSGGVIPVDGVIQEGTAQIDQQALTGEAQPAEKGQGDRVFANTIVIVGKVVVQVDRSGADTTSAQIAKTLLNSVSFKSSVQLKGEKWADQMTTPMLVSAAVAMPFIGVASSVVLINSHIGARIRLFAPLTTLRHISEASTLGILVKDGRALEQLGTVDTILFDKTGTLTTEQPEVKRVTARDNHTVKEVLGYAAAAERKLAHPIAKAILRRAEDEGVVLNEIQDTNYKIGYGVSVVVDGKLIRVGSLRFLQHEGMVIPDDVLAQREDSHALGHTFILVGIDDQVGGTLELEPQVRPEAKEMIAQLRGYGIKHIGIVSGDDLAPTRKLAEELGMDEYFHNVLPEDKAKIVKSLQAKGQIVCFIGDGINDSIALKSANVSISIAGASSIAKDMAEIVLMDGTLNHLVAAVELSKRLEINLQRCLKLCLVPSGLNLLGAFVFKYNILTALLVNNAFAALGVSKVFYTSKKIAPQYVPVPATSTPPAPARAPLLLLPPVEQPGLLSA
jgi:heavy metal translocating P-type ATPase